MARRLSDLLSDKFEVLQGDANQAITALSFDSRAVEKGTVFFAIKGTQVDGHQFVAQAASAGAVVVVVEDPPAELHPSCTYVRVEDTRASMAIAAASFYDHPSHQLKLTGVTGTNGKTSVATLLAKLFNEAGEPAGLISTIHTQIGDKYLPSTHTTPDAIKLQSTLRQMVDAGCRHAFMEVSSHALDQQRVAAITFAQAIFTNISHDHLNYHKTFDRYIDAKKLLFDGLAQEATALVNRDDARAQYMTQNCRAQKSTFALKAMADFKGKILENSAQGLHLQIGNKDVHTLLLGVFNAYNLLAVYGAARTLGMEEDHLLTLISALDAPSGRFEAIQDAARGTSFLVDYAHTPDALKNVLETIQKIKSKSGQVISVVGCGGDRDRTKRPLMAKVAVRYSDQVILTSDNPRTEDPNHIISEMLGGIDENERKQVLCITDRAEAIRAAYALAQQESIVLVAGKGHEEYQEIDGKRLPFSDQKLIRELIFTNS